MLIDFFVMFCRRSDQWKTCCSDYAQWIPGCRWGKLTWRSRLYLLMHIIKLSYVLIEQLNCLLVDLASSFVFQPASPCVFKYM